MYKEDLTDYRLADMIKSLDSCDALKSILPGVTLDDEQSRDLLYMLAMEKSILAYKTGLGKTLMASAYMKCINRKYPGKKFLMFVKFAQLTQTPADVEKYTNLKVYSSDSTALSYERFKKNACKDADVVMLTVDCLDNPNFMYTLFARRNQFHGLIIDEAHEMCNYDTSGKSSMLQSIMSTMRFVVALTATPIITKPEQWYKLIHMIKSEKFDSFRDVRRSINNDNYETKMLTIIRERHDRNHEHKIEWVKPMRHQVGYTGQDLFLKLKGPGADIQIAHLLQLILTRRPSRGLVYTNLHAVTAFAVDKLRSMGISCEYINGNTKPQERARIIKEFLDGAYDVILTNITTALNIPCEYIIFYELTSDYEQFIGRGERGLKSKDMEIIYMVTEDTGEVEYFLKNVYENGEMVKAKLGNEHADILRLDKREIRGRM